MLLSESISLLSVKDLLGQETPEATWLLVRGQLLEALPTHLWKDVERTLGPRASMDCMYLSKGREI